ncbi:unnamed protein product [Rotaria socialis]|uniref:TIR domain-containing protein n=1 Tax=Rotaria socialis TaxID=392032 RepID=A0A818NTM3_9BILA|nr:unnamed protein product [Rotaria socialis]CAF4673739.1 unnamed protein product [Rotaria socialis]
MANKKHENGSYSKSITLSHEMIKTRVKFFHNLSFRTHYQEYLLNAHNVRCQIQLLVTQEIYLTLSGEKLNVKTACQTIPNLFELTHEKIYDDENVDQQMIYCSQQIKSDLIIPVIQQIMDNHNVFTLWEKTAMFYGHFKVTYLTHESFKVSEARITEILNKEISYIENMAMPEEKTRNLLKSIDEFIFSRQNPELVIIRCKYPYKLDIKISLFGRKKLVRKTKKQLQSIVYKHTIKTFQLKMTANQYEYLLENCIHELKDIENEYKDDCVKIRIRLKEFSAPQYLIDNIKQKIRELMIQIVTCQFHKIGNSITLTNDNNKQLNRIARHNYCRIEKLETKTEMKVYSIPKALSPSVNISNSIMLQSNEFVSALSMRKMSVLNGSIEIYLTNQSDSIPRDVTIISSPAGAAEERIEYMSDNGYFEMKTGRKFLFHRWSPVVSDDDRTNQKLKKSIEKFISSTLQSVTTCYSNLEKIVYLTNEWENIGAQQQQQQQLLASSIINEVKQEIETRKVDWRILFIFNEQQTNFYKEFCDVLVKMQTDKDGFAQFSSPVSVIQITLAASSNLNLIKCENEITDYVQKHILANKTLSNEFDVRKWDQHMINAFYKYSLNQSVLPNMDLTNNSQIQLVGSMSNVEKTIEKYKLMSEIFKQKSTLQIPPPVAARTSTRSKQIDLKAYNIYFSFCQQDQTLCNRINNCLKGEGYVLYETPTNVSRFQSYIDKSDVILIAFDEEYLENSHSISELNYTKSARKKIIPFVIRNNTKENSWLSSLTIAESFYDLFDTEIDIEFKDDFDLEYDKLLTKLLRYTKPGTTGKTYAETTALPKITKSNDDYEEAAFGHRSIALQKVTPEQRRESETAYQEKLAKKIENEKIPNDEINSSVADLTVVIEYLEEIVREGVTYSKPHSEEHDTYSIGPRGWELDENLISCMQQFSNSIRRWLNKSPNVIRGNIKPFTPTGDINDAIFLIHQSPNDPSFAQNYVPLDHSPSDKYFSLFNSNPGSCFNSEQSHDYFQKLVESVKIIKDIEARMIDNTIKSKTDKPDDNNNNNSNEKNIADGFRTPEEMRKIEQLDNPNRIWKKTKFTEFIELKIKNILEFKELCEKWK